MFERRMHVRDIFVLALLISPLTITSLSFADGLVIPKDPSVFFNLSEDQKIAVIGVMSPAETTHRVDNWPMERGGPAHTGYCSQEISLPLELRWKYEPAPDKIGRRSKDYGSINTVPIVAHGRLYLGLQDGRLCILDAKTGKLQSEFNLGKGRSLSRYPAFSKGVLYLNVEHRVLAFDTATGKTKWEYKQKGYLPKSSPVVSDGLVYVINEYHHLCALDEEKGDPKWDYTFREYVYASPSVKNEMVYVSTYSPHTIYAFNAKTGNLKWKYRTDAGFGVSNLPVLAYDSLYDAAGNILYCFDSRTGVVKWQAYCDEPLLTPVVGGGKVYAGTARDNLFVYDVHTGRLKGKYICEKGVMPGTGRLPIPAVAGSTVFMSSKYNLLRAFDSEEIRLKWKWRSECHAGSSVVIADGMVYVSSDKGVYAFAPSVSEDTIPPVIQLLSPAKTEHTGTRPMFILKVADETNYIDEKSIEVKLDGNIIDTVYKPELDQVVFLPSIELAEGEHRIEVRLGDMAGNLATQSTSFSVKPRKVAPSQKPVEGWPLFPRDERWTRYHPGKFPSALRLKWRFKARDWFRSAPIIIGDDLFIGCDNGYLYVFDSRTGRLKWKYHTEYFTFTPAVKDSTVYIPVWNTLLAVDVTTRQLKWKRQWDIDINTPIVADETVYVIKRKNLYALNSLDGETKWEFEGGWYLSGPAVGKGVVYTGSHDGYLYALDAGKGFLRWSYQVRGTVSPPALARDMVLVGARYVNGVYALDAQSGVLR